MAGMRSGIRVAAIGGLGVLTALGAAACGSGGGGSHAGGSHPAAGGSPGGVQAVETAYRATMGQKSATFRINGTVQAKNSSGSAENATITGTGQADLAGKAFTMSMNVPTGGSLKMLETGGVAYIQVPPSARGQVPGHKAWLSVNLDKLASQAMLGKSFSQLASAGNDNPTQALSQLAAVSSGVPKVGTATVAGVPTTEYRAEENLNKLASQAKAKGRAKEAQAIRQQEKKLGTSTLPVEVWVDAHHLVRQIRYQAPVPSTSTGGSGHGTVTMTMTFTSFSTPVNVTPPPASQVADITSQVLRQARASSG
jgi:hypothetical protein